MLYFMVMLYKIKFNWLSSPSYLTLYPWWHPHIYQIAKANAHYVRTNVILYDHTVCINLCTHIYLSTLSLQKQKNVSQKPYFPSWSTKIKTYTMVSHFLSGNNLARTFTKPSRKFITADLLYFVILFSMRFTPFPAYLSPKSFITFVPHPRHNLWYCFR